MKKFFLILAILIVVVIVGAVVFIGMNKDKLLEKSFVALQDVVMKQLPASIPADSAQVIFDDGILKIKNGEVDPKAIQDFMLTFKSSMEDQVLDSLEAVTLLDKVSAF